MYKYQKLYFHHLFFLSLQNKFLPVSSLRKTKSVPSIRSFFKGDLFNKEGKVKVGRTLANKPSFFLILNSPCSGLTFADGSLSNRGCPIAPNRIASEARHISCVSFG